MEKKPQVKNIVGALVDFLVRKNLGHLLPKIAEEINAYLKKERKTIRVESTVALNSGQKKKLERTLANKFGRGADFEYLVNPQIMGGLIIKTADLVIDESLRGKLSDLALKLR